MQPFKLKFLSRPSGKSEDGRITFDNPLIELEIDGKPVDLGLLSRLSFAIDANTMVPKLLIELVLPPGSEITFEGGAEVEQKVSEDPDPWNMLGVRRYTGEAIKQIRKTPRSPKTTPPDEYSLVPHKPDIFSRRPLVAEEFERRLREAGIEVRRAEPMTAQDRLQQIVEDELKKIPSKYRPGVKPDINTVAMDVFQLKKMLSAFFASAGLPLPPEIEESRSVGSPLPAKKAEPYPEPPYID